MKDNTSDQRNLSCALNPLKLLLLAFAACTQPSCAPIGQKQISKAALNSKHEERKKNTGTKKSSSPSQKKTSPPPKQSHQDLPPKDALLGPMATLPNRKGAEASKDEYITQPPESRRAKRLRRAQLRRQRKRKRGVVGGVVGGMLGGVIGSSSAPPTPPQKPSSRYPGQQETGNSSKISRVSTAKNRFSTLATDVDTASYARMRESLHMEGVVDPRSIRIEELINYFDYLLPSTDTDEVIRVRTEMGPALWNPELSVLRVAVAAKPSKPKPKPKRNLVFLIDVSGSMEGEGGLDMVRYGFEQLVQTLDKDDRVGIVVYAGSSGERLAPTSGAQKSKILATIYDLEAGGSTHGSAGIRLAYQRARENFIEGGVNRVILATDGDFNVGISSPQELIELIERERESGVYLSVLGVRADAYSDHRMEQLADHGNGNYAYLDTRAEARRVLMHEVAETLDPVADDVKIQVEFDPKLVRSHRLIGYENRRLNKEDFKDDKKDAGDMGDGQMATALFELELEPGDSKEAIAQVAVRYRPVGAKEHRGFKRAHVYRHKDLDDTTPDYRFASAVAQFAQLLQKEVASWQEFAEVHRVASSARGMDHGCKRAEFANLVRSYVIARDVSGRSQDWDPVRCQVSQGPFIQGEEPRK